MGTFDGYGYAKARRCYVCGLSGWGTRWRHVPELFLCTRHYTDWTAAPDWMAENYKPSSPESSSVGPQFARPQP